MLTYADVCRKKRRWRCLRAADYFDGISCPADMFKKSKKEVQVLKYLTLGTKILPQGISCPAGMLNKSEKEVQADVLKSLMSCVYVYNTLYLFRI
jgi:hypothetical protein